jgi:cobalt-zinc-cadmium efflux system outer membrane protein
MNRNYVLLLSMAALSGCASTNADPGFRSMAASVQARTGRGLRWNRSTSEDERVAQAVRGILNKPLTADGAVQIALLRNPRVQAIYEELSLAQADVVQAGLLRNPVFSADITTAEREALDPNLIVGVTQSFLDLLLIPAKKKIAASEFEQAKYRVGSEVLDLAAQVKAAYFKVVAAEQALAMRRAVAEVQQASYELAEQQRAAGGTSELAAMSERALSGQTQLDLARGEAELGTSHEELTRLMGLWGAEVAWRSVDRLPEVPLTEPSLEHIEARAIAESLDLAAMRQEVQTLRYALNLATTSRWTGILDIGADVARLKDGRVVVGPRASIELPIFDQRQAPIARLEAHLRAAERLLQGRAIEVRSEVRDARNRLLYARGVIERYRSEIIPTREALVALSQQQYSAMLLGVYALIQVKQSEVNAYREYIEAVRDYWIARGDVERAIGGALPVLDAGPAAPLPSPIPSGPPAPVSGEHHHPS